jgi:hypothetical protein
MSNNLSLRTRLITGAIYTHKKEKGWVWEALSSLQLKFIGSHSESRYGATILITEHDYVLAYPQDWTITPPFNKYYETIQK